MDKAHTCCVTGHRDIPADSGLPGFLWICQIPGENQRDHFLCVHYPDADALSGDAGTQLPGQ